MKPAFLNASIIFFGLVCIASSSLKSSPTRRYYLAAPFVLYLLYAAGSFYSSEKGEAVHYLLKSFSLAVIPAGFFLVRQQLSRKDLALVLGVYLGALLLSTLFCYGTAVTSIVRTGSMGYVHYGNQEYYLTYKNLSDAIGFTPIYLSMFAILGFVVLLTTRVINSKAVRVALAVYLTIFIFLLASKIGIIIFLLVLLLWLPVVIKRKRVRFLLVVLIIASFSFVVYQFSFINRFTTSLEFNYEEPDGNLWTSTTYRLAIWSSALEAMERKPLIGYGTGAGQKALENIYVEKKFIRGTLDQYNAHNQYFSTALDIGITGLICLSVAIACCFYRGVRTKDFTLLAFAVIITLAFSVESVLVRQKGIVFFTLFYCLLLFPVLTDETESDKQ